MVQSDVPLLRGTMLRVLSDCQDLFWVQRVFAALDSAQWPCSSQEFLEVMPHPVRLHDFSLALTKAARATRPHPALLHAPLSCATTFRFWRGHFDPFTGDKDARDGGCFFCDDAIETVEHVINCPDNPLRDDIDAHCPSERAWLAAPLADKAPSPERILALSRLHHRIWRERAILRSSSSSSS